MHQRCRPRELQVATRCRSSESRKSLQDFFSLVPLPTIVQLGQHFYWWLWTCSWHLPLQGVRLGAFFVRLILYVLFLLPGMLFGLAYWAFGDIVTICYKEKGSCRHTCDLYLPSSLAEAWRTGKPPREKAPVLVIIAGGAFILGHKAYVTMLCRALRSVGFLCIAVDYRYWPQTTIDGMVDDVEEAVAWSIQNSSTYGGDTNQIGILGLSSGAHVGALLLARKAMRRRATSRGAGWSTSDIMGFIGLGGIYEMHSSFMSHLHAKGIDFVLQRLVFGDSETVRESRSPTVLFRRDPELGDGMPSVLLMHGTGDKIVPQDQSEKFREALLAARVDVQLLYSEGEGHNDPVIHCPLMSNHNTVQAIVLAMRRWSGSAGELPSGDSCEELFQDLPTWPRAPLTVIHLARLLTPF